MNTVREFRKQLHLTQQDLADRAGISRAAVSDMERGMPVLRSTLNLVAHALLCKPEELKDVTVVSRVPRGKPG